MAGRGKQNCYHYNTDGKYLGEFESIAEAREMYYSDCRGKYPMFRSDNNYHIFPDKTIASKYRVGRDNIVKFIKVSNNLFRSAVSTPVEVFDIEGNKVAEFKDKNATKLLLGITDNQINSYLRNSGKNLPSNDLGIKIRYK